MPHSATTPALMGAHVSAAGGMHKAIDRAVDLHMTALQVFTKSNRQWKSKPLDPGDIQKWQDRRQGPTSLPTVSHASYLINLAGPKPDVQAKSRAGLEDELERAAALGIPDVVLHPGAHMGDGAEAGIARAAAIVNEVYARRPHLRATRLLFEVMAGQGTVIGRDLAELAELLSLTRDAAHTGICLDTCHLFAAGYEIRTRDGYDRLMSEIDATVGLDAVRCWHFNDSKGDLGSHVDRHEHIGKGRIGESAFAFILNDATWSHIPKLLETPKTVERTSDLKNMQALGSLLDNPEQLPPGLMEEQAPT